MFRFTLRTLILTVALFATQMIGGGLVFLVVGADALPASAPGAALWQLLANLVVVLVLGWFASRSRWRGWRLAVSLALVFWGVATFNSIIEALFFGFFPERTAVAILVMTFVSTLLFTPALLLLSREDRSANAGGTWSLRLGPGRVVAGAAIYTVLYFAFGLAALPFIASFYEGLGTPGLLAVVAMQMLVRGPIFVGLVALILDMSAASRRETILMAAAGMCLLGGVAPLIVPSALFPDAVRWAHFVEVTTENLLFGWILGLLLTRPGTSRSPSSLDSAVAADHP